MRRSQSLLFLVTVMAVLAGGLGGANAAEGDPDPYTLLPGGGVTERLGIGTDTITVYICESSVAAENVHDFTMQEVLDWVIPGVTPYFTDVSGGRYTPQFIAGDTFTSTFDCLTEGAARNSTGNMMVIDRRNFGGGLGGIGQYSIQNGEISIGDLTTPTSSSRRGFYIGGASFANSAIVAHELGHSLGWPHSGSTSTNASTDYDNQTDLMSGIGVEWEGANLNFCDLPPIDGILAGPCEITNTLAINRYASGWIDEDEIDFVMRDGTTMDLFEPLHDGTQMALIPTASIARYLTVEARTGNYDDILPIDGVVVHAVQIDTPCGAVICWATSRRQLPAVDHTVVSGAHVVEVGESKVFDGVTVTVDTALDGGFTVTFTGDPQGCAVGVDPFDDVAVTSFARDAVSCLKVLGITTGTSATTYSPADNVTREQMAAFIGRIWRALDQGCASPATPFTDVASTSFAAADIACIFDLGVTTGTSPTTYGPSGNVTREQMAAFLARLWRSLGNTCSDAATPFVDVASTSFAVDDVACIYHLGITTGTSPTTYAPGNNVTREQMAAFLERFWLAAISA